MIPSRAVSCLWLPRAHVSGVCGPGTCQRFLQKLPILLPGSLSQHIPPGVALPLLLVLFSLFDSVPAFLTIALRLPPGSWSTERSFSAGYCHSTKGPGSSGKVCW